MKFFNTHDVTLIMVFKICKWNWQRMNIMYNRDFAWLTFVWIMPWFCMITHTAISESASSSGCMTKSEQLYIFSLRHITAYNKYRLLMHGIQIESPTKFIFELIRFIDVQVNFPKSGSYGRCGYYCQGSESSMESEEYSAPRHGTYVPWNMHTANCMLCFVFVVATLLVLRGFRDFPILPLGLSLDCPSGRDLTLKDMGNALKWIRTKHSKVQTMPSSLELS